MGGLDEEGSDMGVKAARVPIENVSSIMDGRYFELLVERLLTKDSSLIKDV